MSDLIRFDCHLHWKKLLFVTLEVVTIALQCKEPDVFLF